MAYSASGARNRPDLMEMTMEGLGGADMLQAHRGLFTLTRAPQITGDFGRLSRDETMREEDTTVSKRGGYKRSDIEVGELTYRCRKYGQEFPITDEDLARFGPYGLNEERYAEIGMAKLLRGEARRAYDLTFGNSALTLSGTTGLNVTHEWDDAANATPLADVRVGIDAINGKSGAVGPQMTLGLNWKNLLDAASTAEVRDRFKYTGELRNMNDWDALAGALSPVFGVGRIVVLGLVTNTRPSGLAGVISQLWDPENAWLGVVGPDNSFTAETATRLFYYEGEGMGGLEAIQTYDEPQNDVLGVVRTRQCVQLASIDTDLAFRFGNLVT